MDGGVVVCPLLLCNVRRHLKDVSHQNQHSLNLQIIILVSFGPILSTPKKKYPLVNSCAISIPFQSSYDFQQIPHSIRQNAENLLINEGLLVFLMKRRNQLGLVEGEISF